MRKGAWMVGGLAVLVAMAGSQAQTVALRARYEPGTYVMTTKLDMDSSSTMSEGRTMQQKIAMTMVAEMEVGPQEADGTQTIHLTFKRAVHSVKGGGMEMTYDSADPSAGDPMLAMGMTPMLEHPVLVKMDAKGKVASVSGLDDMWDTLAAKSPGMAQMARGMKEQFGNIYVARMLDWSGNMMPADSVAVGAGWDANRTETVPMLGELPVKETCTLKEIKSTPAGQVAVIAYTSTIEKDKADRPETGSPAAMTITNIKISQTGTMEMLLDSGMPLSRSADRTLSMNLSMTPPAGAETEGEVQAMNVAVRQSGKIEVSVQKGKYVPPATAPAAPPAAVPTAPEPVPAGN